MNWSIHFWGEQIRILNIIDVIIVAILIYQLYRLLKGSLAFNIFLGLVVVYCCFLLVRYLQMPLLTDIFQKMLSVGLIAVVVIFQPEIRRFLLMIGKNTPFVNESFLSNFLSLKKFNSHHHEEEVINFIIIAVENMASSYTGALIIITNSYKLRFDTTTGVPIDGNVTARLIESIFKKGSPLHDGAVIIANNRIVAAKVALPVSENPDLPPRIGLRHRSAVGATEHSDALAIIVSEEKGTVSYARDSKLFQNVSLEELKVVLYEKIIDGQ
jgi:diadenylate cyclase